MDLGEDALHFLQIGPARRLRWTLRRLRPKSSAPRWLSSMRMRWATAGGGDAELLAGQHEALVAGGGLEEAQAVERGQGNHESGRRKLWS